MACTLAVVFYGACILAQCVPPAFPPEPVPEAAIDRYFLKYESYCPEVKKIQWLLAIKFILLDLAIERLRT
jgi:hypothetical protein